MGVLELVVITAAVAVGFLFPTLLMLPMLAVIGFILIALVVWDDHAHDAADDRRTARETTKPPPPPRVGRVGMHRPAAPAIHHRD